MAGQVRQPLRTVAFSNSRNRLGSSNIIKLLQAAPLVVCLGLAGVATVGSGQDAEYDLHLTDEIGQVSRYRLTLDIEMRADVSGPGQPDEQARRLIEVLARGMTLRTLVEYEQKLVALTPEGQRTFEVRWHDYQYTGALGEEEIAPPPGFVASTRKLLNQTALVRTTAAGRTIEVKHSNPELDPGLGQMERGIPTRLPDRPVKVGDRWQSTANIPLGMTAGAAADLDLELEHTLREIRREPEGALAVIGLSGSYSKLQGLEEIGVGEPMHVQASMTGTTTFDITRGRFVGGRYELDMFALHAAEGIEIQLTGHANGNLELVIVQ